MKKFIGLLLVVSLPFLASAQKPPPTPKTTALACSAMHAYRRDSGLHIVNYNCDSLRIHKRVGTVSSYPEWRFFIPDSLAKTATSAKFYWREDVQAICCDGCTINITQPLLSGTPYESLPPPDSCFRHFLVQETTTLFCGDWCRFNITQALWIKEKSVEIVLGKNGIEVPVDPVPYLVIRRLDKSFLIHATRRKQK